MKQMLTSSMLMTAGLLLPLLAQAQTSTVTTDIAPASTNPTKGNHVAAMAAKPVVAAGSVTDVAALQPDPEMQKLLDAFNTLGAKPIPTLTAEQARKQPTMADAVKKELKDTHQKMPDTSDIKSTSASYKDAQGNSNKVYIYAPKAQLAGGAKRPVIVYYHGGGWVIANVKVYESSIIALARKANAVMIAPEYRFAPENKFPASHEDALAGYQWALAHAGEYGGDATRVALAGESAGGNMAVATAIAARDQHLTMPKAILSIYPVAQSNMNTPSYQQNAQATPLSKAMMVWFFKQVGGDHEAQVAANPRINLVAANLQGLPATTVITDSIDPLHDDGQMLADKLKAAGVPTTYQNFPGVTHEFFGADAVLTKAKQAQDLAASQLGKAFGQ